MKAFTIITAIILSLSVYTIYKTTQKEDTYYNRLSKIADYINSNNFSWKAEAPVRYKYSSMKEVKRDLGAILGVKHNLPDVTEVHPHLDLEAAPASFDSRQEWPNCQSIKEIRDQSDCGSCWAFGAVEAMSDRICIHSGQKLQTRVSANDLTACCWTCGFGCNGGQLHAAWSHWKHTGIVTGDLYGSNTGCQPYTLKPCCHHSECPLENCGSKEYPTPKCTKKCIPGYPKTYDNDRTHGKNVYHVTGETKMKAEISTNGPIEVAFTVYEDFETYKSGVYIHKTGQALGGHAVKAIGYGHDADSGLDYWIIVNSWNQYWGDNGTFKILRGKNECGIESEGVAGIPK